ncbi:DUF1385 domain-containing protein [Candidatus Woesearchaeota archaeon]|nr:DUF1385 domain-containing protein [Candidatus Woesearchaeota archaeon]
MGEITLGGQAVIEGVLMRTKTHYAVAVRNDKGSIVVKKEQISSFLGGVRIFRLPFLRGIAALFETLSIGFRALLYSAHVSSGEQDRLSRKEMGIAIALSSLMAVAIFIALPFIFASLLARENLLFNLLDGVLRLTALFAYLIFISFFKDVRRIFEYHGAEHMAIHAYENKKKLTPANIMKYETMHPRCGTSFLLIVVVISVIVFSVITVDHFVLKFFSRIMLLPVVAGISYEFLKFTAKHQDNYFIRPLTKPGIWLQLITTKRPDRKQVEVAVAALKAIS